MGRKFELTLFVLLLFVLAQLEVNAQAPEVIRFPYKLSLDDGIKPGIVEEHFSNANTATRYSERGVEFTNGTKQFGGIGLTGIQFNSTNGIEIEFDYAMYDGVMHKGEYGDGISMFLYDATKKLLMGGKGAPLGYSYDVTSKGVDGAYLGIGLDQFGSFKIEDRGANGMLTPDRGWEFGGISHVTMRAGMGIDREAGYPVLWTLSTQAATHSYPREMGAVLDRADGSYSYIPGLSAGEGFTIRPGRDASGEIIYQRLMVSLVPHISGGFLITIKVKHSGGTTLLCDRYHHDTGTIVYKVPYYDITDEMEAEIPNAFKIGFGAATGDASQVQVIRNLEIRIPYLPEMGVDVSDFCGGNGQTITMMPFENDKVYKGELTNNPTSGNTVAYIDYGSFRFETVDGVELHSDTYTQTGVGKWTYNKVNGKVEFTPEIGYFGEAEIYYSVKGRSDGGGPFGQDIYRSIPTKILVKVVHCGGVTNPNLPSGSGNRLKR